MRAVRRRTHFPVFVVRTLLVVALLTVAGLQAATGQGTGAPLPLLKSGQPVDWWFMFKLNSGKFPGCGGFDGETTAAILFSGLSLGSPADRYRAGR